MKTTYQKRPEKENELKKEQNRLSRSVTAIPSKNEIEERIMEFQELAF